MSQINALMRAWLKPKHDPERETGLEQAGTMLCITFARKLPCLK